VPCVTDNLFQQVQQLTLWARRSDLLRNHRLRDTSRHHVPHLATQKTRGPTRGSLALVVLSQHARANFHGPQHPLKKPLSPWKKGDFLGTPIRLIHKSEWTAALHACLHQNRRTKNTCACAAGSPLDRARAQKSAEQSAREFICDLCGVGWWGLGMVLSARLSRETRIVALNIAVPPDMEPWRQPRPSNTSSVKGVKALGVTALHQYTVIFPSIGFALSALPPPSLFTCTRARGGCPRRHS
jgi:hypothetical protein